MLFSCAPILVAVAIVTTASGCVFQTPATATRADLAAAYIDFEQALAANPPAAERVRPINRAFDEASRNFFLGRFGESIRAISGLTASLRGTTSTSLELLASIKVEFDPPLLRLDRPEPLRVALLSIFPVDAAVEQESELQVVLRVPGAAPARTGSAKVTLSADTIIEAQLELDSAQLAAGRYEVELRLPNGVAQRKAVYHVVPKSLDVVRSENERRLAELPSPTAALQNALRVFRARNRLLTDAPSELNSAEFLSDPLALARELEQEIAQLAAGVAPYARRSGDYWRAFPNGAADVAMRVFAPSDLARAPETPRPLVIALHGAGGDEQMFMDGYGAGRIKRLAEEHGFLVATPLTTTFLAEAGALERLLESLGHDYVLDPARIYTLGHSLGAVAATRLAYQCGDKVAAAVGFGALRPEPTGGRIAPMLVYAAEQDLISPPARVIQAVTAEREKGAPVELRRAPDYGHTLVVGQLLPEAIEWLLARRRD